MAASRRGGSRTDGSGAPPPPTEATLREAALAVLARRALTRAGLAGALERKVMTWARRATRDGHHEAEDVARAVERAHEAIARIVERMVEVGVVDDARFAAARAERLGRAGRSRRAIAAHLAAKGVDAETARDALASEGTSELCAALTLAKKRRLGPFAREEDRRARDPEARQKALGVLARAGFDFQTADRALRMDPEEAEDRLRDRRAL